VTHDLTIGNAVLSATIGFNERGEAAEIFLSGAKEGSTLAAILDDASVVILIALQDGISAQALAKSVSRTPDGLGRINATSVIGAALYFIADHSPPLDE
jgi:hypothetical protein